MKLKVVLILGLFAALLQAQAPQKINYQAIVRDAEGTLLTSQQIGLQLSVLEGNSSGTVIYSESHAITTNPNGLLTLQIGTGAPISGTFSAINWSSSAKYIKTEIDPQGGTDFTIVGTSELVSVPYALYASSAGDENTALDKISEINGVVQIDAASTNNKAFDAGASTIIDFSRSNLAYTSASPQAFELLGIKDGGSYTLAVKGSAAGLASFSASGFTFKSKNNNVTTAATDTLYTFLVMGNTVYFNMITGLQ